MNLQKLFLCVVLLAKMKLRFSECKFDYLNEIFRFKNYAVNSYLFEEEINSCCSNKNFELMDYYRE